MSFAHHSLGALRRMAVLQGDALRGGLSSRAFASNASEAAKEESSQSAKKQQPIPTPTYVYASPGTSMRGASYGFSLRDPVYVVDPSPEKLKPVQQQPSTQTETKNKSRVGLKVDDYANQAYVATTRGSMHDPRYISISDPQDRDVQQQK